MLFDMKSKICLCHVFLLFVSGCSGHISNHCQLLTDRRADPPEERENYNPWLTPVSDTVSECYCVAEDGVLAVGIAVVWVVCEPALWMQLLP